MLFLLYLFLNAFIGSVSVVFPVFPQLTVPSSVKVPIWIPKVVFTKAKVALHLRKGVLLQRTGVEDNMTVVEEEIAKTKQLQKEGEMFSKENGSLQTKILEADVKDVYRVICDLENYKAWGGTGVMSTKVLSAASPQKEQPRSIITEIRCGAFGFSFKMDVISYFQMPQKINGAKTPYSISFKLMEKVPFVDVFEGRYLLTPIRNENITYSNSMDSKNSPQTTSLTFESMVKFSGPIPGFVQTGIKNLVNDIAVKELSKYCEGGLESRMSQDFLHRPVVDWCEINGKYSRFAYKFKYTTPAMVLENFKTWTNPRFSLRWMQHNVYKFSTDIRQSTLNILNISSHLVLMPKETDASIESSTKKKSIHQTTLFFLFVQKLLFFPKLLFEKNQDKNTPTIHDAYQNLLIMASNGEEICKDVDAKDKKEDVNMAVEKTQL